MKKQLTALGLALVLAGGPGAGGATGVLQITRETSAPTAAPTVTPETSQPEIIVTPETYVAGETEAPSAGASQDLSGVEIAPGQTTLDLDTLGIRVWDCRALAEKLDGAGAESLERVFLFDSELPTADMEWLFDRYYPRIFFGFTLHIGPHTIRTDQTAFSTLHYSSPTKEDPRHTSEELYPLRMCRRLKALDLGHNYLTDLNFLYYMPEMEVLIISPNYGLTDISPIAACENLVYLECFNTPITDLTPLQGLTKLRDLNLTRDGQVTDLSPLYDLPNLERVWWGPMDKVPGDQKKIMRQKHPGCKFVMVYDPTDGGWRRHPHFNELHAFFRTGVYVPFAE